MVRGVAETTMGGYMKRQQTIDTFSARAGSSKLGENIYNSITEQALNSGQDINEALSSSMSFMSNTTDPAQLTQLNKIAMRLSMLNPAEGLQEAALSLKELMNGDSTSMAERFGMNSSMIQNSTAMKAGHAGDLEGFIKGMDELLNSKNVTEEAFENMLDTPAAKWKRIIEKFKFNLASTGQSAVSIITPAFDTINKALEEGKFQPFFNMISIGLSIIAAGTKELVDGFMWIGDVIQQNWGIIEPILAAIGTALVLWAMSKIPALTGGLWNMLNPIVSATNKFFMMNLPILIIGAAIGFLIYAMIKWGDTTVEVIGFIGGLFGTLLAFLYNGFAYFANIVLSVAEFFANVWRDPVYAVKKLFYDLVINVLQYMEKLAKGIENIINKIPGLKKINITSGIDNLLKNLNDARDSLKSEKDVVDLMRFNQKDYGDAFKSGQSLGKTAGKFAVDKVQNVFGKVKDTLNIGGKNMVGSDVLGSSGNDFNNFSNIGTDNLGNIGRVGEVGKINHTVDISSEDLKTMRELAEMKSVQNFVTLTPTVSVQTGDITNGYDIDTIITRITNVLETEIVSSAEGVYN